MGRKFGFTMGVRPSNSRHRLDRAGIPAGLLALIASTGSATAQCTLPRPITLPPHTFFECSSTTFPNDFPACATIPNQLFVGDSIAGFAGLQNPLMNSCTPYVAGNEPATIDYWRPKTKPGPTSEWICCTIKLTNPLPKADATMYGLRQLNGNILYGNYTEIGKSEESEDGLTIRFCINNKQYQPLFSVAGSTTPGAPYQGTLECGPAERQMPPGGLTSGPITLRAAPGNHNDLDMVVFDSELNPIPGYLHDDPDDSGFTRFYPPGEYTVVVSDFDLVTNLASDVPDEEFRDGAVLEHPNGVVCSSPALVPNMSIVVTDSVGSYTIPASKDIPFGMVFFTMIVRPPGLSHEPGGIGTITPQVVQACPGSSVLIRVQPTQGGFPPAPVTGVEMDLSALGLPAPSRLFDDGTNGDEVPRDGVYSLSVPLLAGVPPFEGFLPFSVHDAIGRRSTGGLFISVGACNPCPVCAADFNNDGGIDGDDVSAFFQAWDNGLECGDVNLDGGIDGSDIEHFYALWERGGC